MGYLDDKSGIAPELRKVINGIADGLSGNITLAVSPATCGSSAAAVATAIESTAAKYQRKVRITMPEWFNGSLSVAATKSSTSGLVAINGGGASVTCKNGEAEVVLNYTGTWAAADTATLTVSGTVAGVSLSQTSVDTLIA